MTKNPFNAATIHAARSLAEVEHLDKADTKDQALVNDLIGLVANKWKIIVLAVLAKHGELRFTQLSHQIPEIGHRMLTQTLRQMERDGMIIRTVYPVVPPRVDYRLTDMGRSLNIALCNVWFWAEENISHIRQKQEEFDAQEK